MIKFFRKIRQKLLTENKFSKYLLYAMGEILLVIIGILLALQINTWNNERVAKNHQKEIYKQIQNDLKTDTTYIGQIDRSFGEKDKRIQNILNKKITSSFYDTITSKNFKDCIICIIETTSHPYFFKPLTKGYSLLNNSRVIGDITGDSIAFKIDEFYTNGISIVESGLETVEIIEFENIKSLEQYSWFADWQENKYNKDFLIFIFESEAYRNQLARYRLYYKSYINNLRLYKLFASNILELIEIELQKE